MPEPSISTGDFHFNQVRPFPLAPEEAPAPPAQAPLGPLSNFTGEFAGTGFNMIFRPNSNPPTTTLFPNPVTPTPPAVPNENVLELNLTTETLTFSAALGNVPNRGLQVQNDIFLNAVPYVQAINDVTNPATGKADGPATGIHFEPGLWVHVPATNNVPVLGESLVRLASIPHGTTINAQTTKIVTTAGPPTILPVSITPFVIGTSPPNLIAFAAQIAANSDTPRIPQDLTRFIAAGTITQAILDDPNTVLREAIAGQKITQTIVFTVGTPPDSTVPFGGGTDNIAFLEGNAAITTPNADAVSMTATFWIETVEHRIPIPILRKGESKKIAAPARPGHPTPVFLVEPPHDIPAPIVIIVHSTQIQYSQSVFLNFAGLTWPHVSVATLVPTGQLTVPASAWP
ncbi:MAG TPA: heme-binding protein [Roseiarcus sp.]|nr:heme-binding protein [Roseiarcus sp.]